MFIAYNIILFVVTLIGGSIPLWNKTWTERSLKNLLAFSGAFLLSITMLHLLPETLGHHNHLASILVIVGFFLQQIIQMLTHGVEHGHLHGGHNHDSHNVLPLFVGLGIHAFSEGLPLGIGYSDTAITPSLYLAVLLHKLPEAMLIASILLHNKSRQRAWFLLVLFAGITPAASMLTAYLDNQFLSITKWINYCIPLVAGIFIHISTTIFFESGTKAHEMKWKRWLVIAAGIGLALLTTVGHSH